MPYSNFPIELGVVLFRVQFPGDWTRQMYLAMSTATIQCPTRFETCLLDGIGGRGDAGGTSEGEDGNEEMALVRDKIAREREERTDGGRAGARRCACVC
jgi:hypothetical protein